jgi:hypothetical protein
MTDNRHGMHKRPHLAMWPFTFWLPDLDLRINSQTFNPFLLVLGRPHP